MTPAGDQLAGVHLDGQCRVVDHAAVDDHHSARQDRAERSWSGRRSRHLCSGDIDGWYPAGHHHLHQQQRRLLPARPDRRQLHSDDSAQQQELAIENTDARQPNVQHQPFIAVSASFTITVVDNRAPTISHPDITVHTSDPAGIVVNYGAPAAADNSGIAPTVSCTPATGIVYPVGTTLVTCVATDGLGRSGHRRDRRIENHDDVENGLCRVPGTLTSQTGSTTQVTNPVTTGTLPVQLPATGIDFGQSLRFAVALSIAGFLLLVFARRRKLHI